MEPREPKDLRDYRATEEATALQETLVQLVHQDSREMLVHWVQRDQLELEAMSVRQAHKEMRALLAPQDR